LGEVSQSGEDRAVRVHKGFVYSDTLGVEPNFRVAARETVEFASGWYELRDVEVTLYHKGEVAYGLVAQNARFNPSKREALAKGDALLSLGGGVAVRAAGFVLHGAERALESEGEITFAGAGWAGIAGGLESSLNEDTVKLVERVTVVWRSSDPTVPSLVLLAPDAEFFRRQGMLDFHDGLTLLRGSLRGRSVAATVQFAGSGGPVKRITMADPVTLDGTLTDGSEVEIVCGQTSIEAIEANRLRLIAQAPSGLGWVRLSWRDPLGRRRSLEALRLVGEGSRGSWDWLEGQETACASEVAEGAIPRLLEATALRIAFADGRPGSASAVDGVRVEQGSQWAEGDRLNYSFSSRVFTLLAAKNGRVRFGGGDTLAVSDSAEGTEGGLLVARGEVSGIVERGAPWGATDAPLRFAAQSASAVGPAGGIILLEGSARLWQQDRLVSADKLEYDRANEVVKGLGNVVTIASLQGPQQSVQRVEVRARSLRYDRLAGSATYEGEVILDDPRATASCQRLVAGLGSHGEVRSANLEGGVVMEEAATRRRVTGQRAALDPINDVLDIWGAPVLVEEPSGNQMKADHLRWLRATGTILVVGKEDNPSETIYHPTTEGPSLPRRTPRPRGRTP